MDTRILMPDPQISSTKRSDENVSEYSLEMSFVKQDVFFTEVKHASRVKPVPGRFYGWLGHQDMRKRFKLVSGSFLLLVVRPDNWENPSQYLQVLEFILSEENRSLDIPDGYVTGYKALEADSEMEVFSNFSLEESVEKEYKFDASFWYFESFF